MFVDQKMQAEWERYRRGSDSVEPRFGVNELSIANREALEYRSSYDPNTTTYVIPFADGFMLDLMFESAGSVDAATEWQAILDRERAAFIASMEISGIGC